MVTKLKDFSRSSLQWNLHLSTCIHLDFTASQSCSKISIFVHFFVILYWICLNLAFINLIKIHEQSTFQALTNSEICMSLSVLAKISQSFKNKRYSRFFCRNVSYLWKAVKFMEWEIEKYGFHHWLELEKYFEMLINFN